MKLRCIRGTAVTMAVLMLLSGCSGKETNLQTEGTKVDKVLEEQIAATQGSTAEPSEEAALPEEDGTQTESQEGIGTTEGVDYDLSVMSNDMAYAMLYQFTEDPETYIGKTVRMRGIYSSTNYETRGIYYLFVTVYDEAACCVQGMEFIWEDGSHVYPDEYPPEGTLVEVTGVFETYQLEEDIYPYCRLKDASLVILE